MSGKLYELFASLARLLVSGQSSYKKGNIHLLDSINEMGLRCPDRNRELAKLEDMNKRRNEISTVAIVSLSRVETLRINGFARSNSAELDQGVRAVPLTCLQVRREGKR